MQPAPSETGSQFRLLIHGDGSVRTLPLHGTRWVIGRAIDCDVPLRDPTVSRRHVLLERRGDVIRFMDLGGSNPVLLDGRPQKHGILGANQTLTVGMTRLQLEPRLRPTPLATQVQSTVLLSREVVDDELPAEAMAGSFATTAFRVLTRIEWTFADLGDITDAAEPLLDLSLNLTNRRRGWIGRFQPQGDVETLATIDIQGGNRAFLLPESLLQEARRIGRPHLLTTQEANVPRNRLVIPFGSGPNGLLVLEDPADGAAGGQELLRLAQAIGKVVWHRLEETTERLRLRDELQRLRFHGTAAHNALLASTRLQDARLLLRTLAGSEAPVLLIGEPGTEREDLARYLHAESPRRRQPFVPWSAARVPAGRHEVELFGDGRSGGAMQRAAGGTLFVDDFDHLSPALQEQLAASLLALATAGNPPQLIAAIATAPVERTTASRPGFEWLPHQQVEIPPLRGHSRDVLALSELMLSEFGTGPDGAPRLLSERSKRLLIGYAWPGNVRELRLVLEDAAAQAGSQPIAPRHLPPSIASEASGTAAPDVPTLEEVERQHIQDVMARTGGNRSRAAQILGIASSTLYEKLKRFRIDT